MKIAILAGGKSSRFGRDKAEIFLPLVVEACRPAGLPIVVVGHIRIPSIASDVTFLPDALPGQGPLGGIVTLFREVSEPVLLLACDLPDLRYDAIAWLLESWQAHSEASGLVVARIDKGDIHLEPLFAIYSPACLELAEDMLRGGKRSMHHLLERMGVAKIPLPDAMIPQLRNVNTPDTIIASSA
ncbi:molybdenum cofactor guanylyltransferase [Armatimonas sp.]|uniref:molybdenum cofactor guanylyltransferase n=1 Tax=Armatimonas sp. TaxID=1872638 RepID=UPI00286B7DCB|nr:molybdenum cofactor guanylyltransferase [Armatimonas sp.]